MTAVQSPYGSGLADRQAFYVDSYSGTDDQKFSSALTDLFAAGGGDIVLSPRHYVFADKWATAYQAGVVTAVRIVGAGVGFDSAGGQPTAATSCDMQYAGSGAARMDFQHVGTIEISGILFTDTVGSAVPFIQITNPTPRIHGNGFKGSATYQDCYQDAIVLGGTTTTIGGGDSAAFAGYQAHIHGNFYAGIRRAVRVRTYGNGSVIEGETISVSCGAGTIFQVADGAMTAGSATLTSATAGFTSAMVGQAVLVMGAGSPEQGGILAASISAVVSATQVTLSASAAATVSAAAAVAPEAFAIELDAGPAQLSGVVVSSCSIEASYYPVAIGLLGATMNLIAGCGLWDAAAGRSFAGIYADAGSTGNTVLHPVGGYAGVGGTTLAEETQGVNTLIDTAASDPRGQLATPVTFSGPNASLGLRFGPQGGAADVTLQRTSGQLLLQFLTANGYLRAIGPGPYPIAIAGRTAGAAYDYAQLTADGNGYGVLALGTGTGPLVSVMERVGANLYGTAGGVSWIAYGGERWRTQPETAAATVPASGRLVIASAVAGAFTLTLTDGNDGEIHTIIKADSSANAVTVQSSGGQQINGAASYTLSAPYAKATFVYSTYLGEWIIVG